MRKISLLWCVLLCFAFIFVSYADDEPQHSIIAASFTYHFYPTGKHNQYFNNEFIAYTWRSDYLNFADKFIVGTLSNSSDNRCLLLGVGRDWQQLNPKTKVVGVYAYVGEFFTDTFDECGRDGIYHDFDTITGIGFASYIYHGLKYNFINNLHFNGGLILPGVVSFTLQATF